jgi:uncharacterized membrane protein
MTPRSYGQLIDVLISVGLGVYFILAGMGIIRVSKNPKRQEEWKNKYGRLMGICGAVIIVFRILGSISQ